MKIREYIQVKPAGVSPDPATYCPANGYIINPINPADGWNLLAEFQTNSPYTTTFDPTITASSGEYAWDLGDGTYLVGDKAVSHTYLTTATRTVKLYGKGTCTITAVDFNSDNIVGELDLSNDAFKSLTSITLNTNTLMTSVLFPSTNNGSVTGIYIYSTGVTGTLDLSSFSSFTSSAAIRLYSNAALTGITWASTITGTFVQLWIYSTAISGTLDLSKFSSFSSAASILLYSNAALTGITWASTITGTFTSIQIYQTAYSGTLDLSKFSSFTTTASLSIGGSGITGITWASSITGTFSVLYVQSTGITGTIDLSKFSAFTASADVQVIANASATSILFSSSTITGIIKILYLYGNTSAGYVDLSKLNSTGVNSLLWRLDNNGWSAAIVNQVLVNIDGISAAGFTGRIINIGGTNADPDTTSGGYNGTAARNQLITDGFTVTIT